MRKFQIVSLVLIVLILFSGCTDGTEPKVSNSPESTKTAEATGTPIVTVVPTETPEPTPEVTPLPTVEPGKGTHAGAIDASKAKKASFYGGSFAGQSAERISGNFAVQFFATTTFNKVSIAMPTWTQKEGHSVTFSLYAWQGSYDATFKKDPIKTEVFENWEDGVEVILQFDEQPDGEYLLELYNHDSVSNVGFWFVSEVMEYVRTYLNDEEWDSGTPRLEVYYTKTPTNLHGPIQDSGL